MIICSSSNIDLIYGIEYADAEGITHWLIKKITQTLPKNFLYPRVISHSLGTTPSSSHSPTKSINHKSPPTIF